MKPTFYRVLALCVALFALMSQTAAAQGLAVGGAVANMHGDLYEYDPNSGAVRRLTEWGYNSMPVQSPDGRYIAYMSISEEAVRANDMQTLAGAVRSNIWLLDRQTGEFTRIAAQSGAGFFRGEPFWSPDSLTLGWSETDAGDNAYNAARIVLYNLNTRTPRTLAPLDLGFQDGGLSLPLLMWGEFGITRLLYSVPMGEGDFAITLEVYNPNNGTRTDYPVGSTGTESTIVIDYFWVQHSAGAQVAYVTRTGQWYLLDVRDGTTRALNSAPSLATSIGRDTYILTPFIAQTEPLMWGWNVDANNGQSYTLPYSTYVISRWGQPALGGDNVLWNATTHVMRWNTSLLSGSVGAEPEGIATPYNFPPAVVWQPTTWFAQDGSVQQPTPPNGSVCSLPARLSAGQTAVVAPGVPNNLRADPTLSARVLGVIPAGTSATILSGAVCADGIHWYEVQAPIGRGWTAEGVNGEYWLSAR